VPAWPPRLFTASEAVGAESVLSKLAELKPKGLLTDDQFNTARAKILGES
jgi:hypothetical protein